MMDFLKPENLLQSGYKDCLLCEVERKGEEARCLRCVGQRDQRDRLLWEINRERIRRNAGRLSLAYPGAGHFYSGRYLTGTFWACLLPLCAGMVLFAWRGPTLGHAFLLGAFGLIWYLARVDAVLGPKEPAAPCQVACPADINVPDYIALVREGRPLEALALVHDKLPFAAFCGRACPHPCEQKCVRTECNAPIAIMAIKRYAADVGYAAAIRPSSPAEGDGRRPKVAVVGAGPAGLSAADTLARLGCLVTVFDQEEEPGGMMRYAVPEFRFPQEALVSDLRTIFARGVDFRGGRKFGRDLSFEGIAKEGFEAVLLASGAGEPLRLPRTGGEEEGFFDGLSFLSRFRGGNGVLLRGSVVVIGGGKVALDAARVAVRLGAREVTMACLESRESMPAYAWEVEEAEREGVRILAGTAVEDFVVRDGRVARVEALRVEGIGYDAQGRIVPRTVPGSEFGIPAETVIQAIGIRPALDFLPPDAKQVRIGHAPNLSRLIFPVKQTTIPAYATGDCVGGPGTVVEASASGREAALNIYADLRVEEVRKARFEDRFRRMAEPQVEDRPEWRVRREARRIPPEESRRTFQEVQKRYDDHCVRRESERCARCNLWL
ncbi:MAG: FAD-dependent oxidoreductase [Deltaproteobacteria bacterium]|nr:FAD-dependent oxidoreductase [Deltaproteobacteria bacterium]